MQTAVRTVMCPSRRRSQQMCVWLMNLGYDNFVAQASSKRTANRVLRGA